jgi:hypothetical protein
MAEQGRQVDTQNDKRNCGEESHRKGCHAARRGWRAEEISPEALLVNLPALFAA